MDPSTSGACTCFTGGGADTFEIFTPRYSALGFSLDPLDRAFSCASKSEISTGFDGAVSVLFTSSTLLLTALTSVFFSNTSGSFTLGLGPGFFLSVLIMRAFFTPVFTLVLIIFAFFNLTSTFFFSRFLGLLFSFASSAESSELSSKTALSLALNSREPVLM